MTKKTDQKLFVARPQGAATTITITRLEAAIDITIEAMTLHSLPLPHLKWLEAERDRLGSEGDPLEHAKRLRAQRQRSAA